MPPLDTLRKPLLRCLPVDDVPDGLEVFGLAVLVLKAVARQKQSGTKQPNKLTSMRAPKHRCRELV